MYILSLFKNKWFTPDEMFQWNSSKANILNAKIHIST